LHEPEVDQRDAVPARAVNVDHDIAGLKVAKYASCLVHGLKSDGDVLRDGERAVNAERAGCARLREGCARGQIHRYAPGLSLAGTITFHPEVTQRGARRVTDAQQ
jgi:hypothetical protein